MNFGSIKDQTTTKKTAPSTLFNSKRAGAQDAVFKRKIPVITHGDCL